MFSLHALWFSYINFAIFIWKLRTCPCPAVGSQDLKPGISEPHSLAHSTTLWGFCLCAISYCHPNLKNGSLPSFPGSPTTHQTVFSSVKPRPLVAYHSVTVCLCVPSCKVLGIWNLIPHIGREDFVSGQITSEVIRQIRGQIWAKYSTQSVSYFGWAVSPIPSSQERDITLIVKSEWRLSESL